MLTVDKGFINFDKYIDKQTGFLHVDAVVARSGIQEYFGFELGETEEPNRVFNVYRPQEEVLHKKSLESYINAPVTLNHPEIFVTVENSKELIKGSVSSVETFHKDGIDYVKVKMTITDQELIDLIQNGQVEISAGYSQNLIKQDGFFMGEPYQFRQTDIKINHIAIVSEGRCGNACKIVTSDNAIIQREHKQKGKKMASIVIDSVQHEVSDCVARHISDMSKKLKALDEEIKKKDEELEKKEEELEKVQAEKDMLEEEVKNKDMNAPEILAEINERVQLLQELLAEGIEVEASQTAADMKRVYVSRKSNVSLDGKSSAYIEAAFDMLRASRVKGSQANVVDGFQSRGARKSFADLANVEVK